MIWLAWRRLRTTVVASALVVVVVIIAAIVVGRPIHQVGAEFYGAPCHGGGWGQALQNYCGNAQEVFASYAKEVNGILLVLAIVVTVIAAVIGAVAVGGEFDRGTVRWAWSQSRTRRQWWIGTTVVALG